MLRVNHCFRNCSTHSRDFSAVSGSRLLMDTAAGVAGVSATSSFVAEAADSFEAVAEGHENEPRLKQPSCHGRYESVGNTQI